MRLVARLSGDSDANDDLVQEVGVRAFEGFRGFRNESAAYTWLYRIAVNVVLRWREKRRHDTIPLDSPEASQVRSEGAGPEQRAMQSSLRPAVWAAMATLPEEQRTTLILQVYEGLRYREIGEVLEIPIGTVKSRLNIAMRRMKKELQDYAL
jgi:RNA polymerase sigma-70 factor (ECF subfamily)